MAATGKAVQAYQLIEEMIVACDLEAGSLVSEAQLMERTGLGRTPVREALQQLARHQMVEIHPSKGVLIPPLSIEGEFRMLEMRRVLETLAVRLACHRATAAERADIETMARTLRADHFTLQSYADTVKGTHHLVARTAHNDHVSSALAPVQGLSRRFWLAHVRDEQREIAAGRALHLAILDAVLAQDPEAGEQASRDLNDYLERFARDVLDREHPATLAEGGGTTRR